MLRAERRRYELEKSRSSVRVILRRFGLPGDIINYIVDIYCKKDG